MPLSSRDLRLLCLALGAASLSVITGCGSGGGVILPHTTGNYSNASLKGQYVFLIHGQTLQSTQTTLYREAGVLVADGAGSITSASIEDFSTGSAVSSVPNGVSGTYSIAKDGTGFITLNGTGLGQSAGSTTIQWAATLVSPSQISLMEVDSFADGAGEAELQDSTAIATVPAGNFVFRLHEFASNSLGSLNFMAEVGAITVSSGGSITNGNMDQNLNGSLSSLTLNGTLGSLTASTGRGMGTFTDSSGATTGLVFYIVNSGKLELLCSTLNSGQVVGSGSAELQTGAVGNGLSGSYVFASRGDDSASGVDAIASVGQFTANSTAISSGVYDSAQDANTYSQSATFTGTIGAASAQGRVQATLSDGTIDDFWMISPARGFFVGEATARNTIADGTADLQTVSSFSNSTLTGQFAMVMDGFDLTPEILARIGTLQFDGKGRLTLVELVNATASGVGNSLALSGSDQVGSNGRVVASVSNNSGRLEVVMYAVSASRAYVLQTDNGTQTSGTVELQH